MAVTIKLAFMLRCAEAGGKEVGMRDVDLSEPSRRSSLRRGDLDRATWTSADCQAKAVKLGDCSDQTEP
jgi:hypothetical protein